MCKVAIVPRRHLPHSMKPWETTVAWWSTELRAGMISLMSFRICTSAWLFLHRKSTYKSTEVVPSTMF